MRVTQERLKELLDYDPLTGVFVWRPVAGKVNPYAGRRAGYHTHVLGYVMLRVDYRLYKAHRLAWLYVTGEWPAEDIDHINGERSDNKFSNLRLATDAQNLSNRGPQKNNTSGYKGVYFDKRANKWFSKIVTEGRQIHLGYFSTAEEAYLAYCRAARFYHGEFARVA